MQYKTVESKITFLKLQKKIIYNVCNKDRINLVIVDKPISTDDYLKLYTEVGEHYNWLDRIFMKKETLYDILNSDKTQIYSFYINDEFAGYCELVLEDEYVEILYFGLAQKFIGKGYGKFLLSKTIEKAWSYNPQWIQLNTCDLDHSNALNTYKSLGFIEYKTLVETKTVKTKHL